MVNFVTVVLLISFVALPIRGLSAAHLLVPSRVYPVQILDGVGPGLQSVAVPGLVARVLNGTGRVNVGLRCHTTRHIKNQTSGLSFFDGYVEKVSLDYLDGAAKSDKPFFMNVNFMKAHQPTGVRSLAGSAGALRHIHEQLHRAHLDACDDQPSDRRPDEDLREISAAQIAERGLRGSGYNLGL